MQGMVACRYLAELDDIPVDQAHRFIWPHDEPVHQCAVGTLQIEQQ